MRLLHTTNLKLSEFFGAKIPPYAILSHRWADSEVTFFDLQNGTGPLHPGWGKVLGCCHRARNDGYEYVWIDSCCIDKSSSAELSEAINSMFQWYQVSQVCYAHLSDVSSAQSLVDIERLGSEFRASKWFTRGWTLQELLAPELVIFFDWNWVEIGTKSSLEPLISSITGIKQLFQFSRTSNAQKMSWASNRETLRPEDMAYCLMGLFGVNMPLLYGEGDKAFIQLQIEIMRISDDESIFAWTDSVPGNISGLLAQSPVAFRHSGDIELLPNTRTAPYSMTNKGLQIQFSLLRKFTSCLPRHIIEGDLQLIGDPSARSTYEAALCCARKDSPHSIAIELIKRTGYTEQYARSSCDELFSLANEEIKPLSPKTIFVRQGERPLFHRGATMILLKVRQSKISRFCTVEFYPGLFISGKFEPQDKYPAGVMVKEDIDGPRLGDGGGRVLELGHGIAMITFVDSDAGWGTAFILELDIAPDKSPTVDVLFAADVTILQRRVTESLTDGGLKKNAGSIRRTLKSGSCVDVKVVEQFQEGLAYYLVDVKIEDPQQ